MEVNNTSKGPAEKAMKSLEWKDLWLSVVQVCSRGGKLVVLRTILFASLKQNLPAIRDQGCHKVTKDVGSGDYPGALLQPS